MLIFHQYVQQQAYEPGVYVWKQARSFGSAPAPTTVMVVNQTVDMPYA